MDWQRYVDRDEVVHYYCEDPKPKKLVDRDKREYHIIREKISMAYQAGTQETIFVVDGHAVMVRMHISNALEWWNSPNDD